MTNVRACIGYILISVICSIISVLIVGAVASKGVQVNIGSGVAEPAIDEVTREKQLSDHQERAEQYKSDYLETHDTWIKQHHSYNPGALLFSWLPWVLPALIWNGRRWSFLLSLLPVPLLLSSFGLFIPSELLVFFLTVTVTCFMKSKFLQIRENSTP